MSELDVIVKRSKEASRKISLLNTGGKNEILCTMADNLENKRDLIKKSNEKDIENAQKNGLNEWLVDRLFLDDERIDRMIDSVRKLIVQKDYIGEVISKRTLENGLRIEKVRTGFGVIGVIYESRPNVTTDVCAMCLKSSSSVILKGGKEALNTNKILVKLLQNACTVKYSFQLIESSNRTIVNKMLRAQGSIDLIFPRGGESLIRYVRENSTVPVIETGTGICHVYVDSGADIEKSINIIINAKTQRPSVCNAIETILVHKDISVNLLRKLYVEFERLNVEIRGCKETQKIIKCKKATDVDWITEYLDKIISVKVVNNITGAINHINKYGSHHSDSIISNNELNIKKFNKEVDSAVVYSNASTRFTDGYEFGLGAEMGISTQKLHARGPIGLEALTSYKYIVKGNGQIRK